MKRSAAHITLFLLTLFLFKTNANGQDYPWLSSNNMMVEARGHFGFFYHHHFEMEGFDAHYSAFEASIYQSTYGKEEWQILYNYPYIGATFYHTRLGGFDQLGKVYALYPFINYPLFRNDTWMTTFKFGVGLAWLTRCFDHLDNYANFSIGSHLNGAVNLSFEYRHEITPRLISVGSLGLIHFSNGATKSPNYGLNTFSAAWGLAYYLRDPRANALYAKRPEYYKYEFDGKNWFSVDLAFGMGIKDVSQTFGKNEPYRVYEGAVRAMAQFTTCSRAGLSFSITKDNSDKATPGWYTEGDVTFISSQHTDEEDNVTYQTIRLKEYQLIKPNLGLCYSMTMKRLSYLFELGVHLDLRARKDGVWKTHPILNDDGSPVLNQHGKPIEELPTFSLASNLIKGSLYQKITLQYELRENLFAQLALTTHLARADYLCAGISYRFNQKYYLNKNAKSSKPIPGLH